MSAHRQRVSSAPPAAVDDVLHLDGIALSPAEGAADEAPDALHPSTWAMLRALRAGRGLSRNRHFALFARPEIKKALQIHRFLNSVVTDLERADGEVRVARLPRPPEAQATAGLGSEHDATAQPGASRAAGTCGLRIELAHLHGRRTVYLSGWELALLAEQAPEVALRLDRLLATTPA